MTIYSLLAAVLVAAASPSPPPGHVAGGVNFDDFTYPAPPCSLNEDRAPSFTLSNGVGSWDDDAAKESLSFQLVALTAGDLRGDGSLQAAVVLGCDYPDPGFYNQWILIFDVRGGTAKIIARLVGGDENGPVEKVRILDRRLYVDRALNTESCRGACATNEVTTYRLSGSKIVILARRAYIATPRP